MIANAMAESLCQASVFAALSEYEAHPVAVMEALTLGIPTVGLDDNWELVNLWTMVW